MLVILFCNLVCLYEYIYVRSNLAVVVFFIVKSESKRSPGTNFAAEDVTENIRAIFVYSCEFRIDSNSRQTFEYSKFKSLACMQLRECVRACVRAWTSVFLILCFQWTFGACNCAHPTYA